MGVFFTSAGTRQSRWMLLIQDFGSVCFLLTQAWTVSELIRTNLDASEAADVYSATSAAMYES